MSFLLQEILQEPEKISDLDNAQFNRLIPQARCSKLLATLALELQQAQQLEQLPAAVRRHLDSAVMVHEKQKRDLAYDTGKIRQALNSIGVKLVLLKGAAYLKAEIPASRGRLISDIDIIVPHHDIDEVENTLNLSGWESSYVDTYNERYFRKWMHEIPPLSNRKRGTTLDMHHTILPPTADANIDASLLFDNLLEVQPGIFTLSREDMVIHSATHLFHEGEFPHGGLRDLWDIDHMLRDFSECDSEFWTKLVARAGQLDLLGSLFHGLTYSQRVFQTPVPPDIIKQVGSWGRALRKPMMDFLYLRVFRPDQPDCKLPFTGMALSLLYIRSHYLRMPLYLLLPHLARKAWMRRFGNESTSAEEKETEAD